MELIARDELVRRLRTAEDDPKTEAAVRAIVRAVRSDGDAALARFAERFDGVKNARPRVPEERLRAASRSLDRATGALLRAASARIERYHRAQMPRPVRLAERDCALEFRFAPVERVGFYIPGGQSPLVSTILMGVVPARVAGVRDIVACSPPSSGGTVHPAVAAALFRLGVRRVFAVGGAQAVAAMAYGTQTVPRVDLIVGPGNRYVNVAKRLVQGAVGIDALAGPSEVAIVADETADPRFVEADLKAQIEHTDGLGVLVTTSRRLGETVAARVPEGVWLLVRTPAEAVEIVNLMAPEHLQIVCRRARDIARRATAGAVFIGNYSPAALGDYLAGPSHILPTGRAARFSSGVSVHTFLRRYAVIAAGREYFQKYGKLVAAFAELEGLDPHAAAAAVRLDPPGRRPRRGKP